MSDDNNKSTDIFETINKVNVFIAGKHFKYLFFIAFLAVIIYNHSNIKIFGTKKNKTENENKPFIKTINPKRVVEEKILEKKREQEVTVEQIREKGLKEADEMSLQLEKENKIMEEFKESIPPNAKKIKIGDILNIKMVLVNKDTLRPMGDVLKIQLIVSRSDILSKYFVGKKVGNIVTIPAHQMVKDIDIEGQIKKISANEVTDLNDPTLKKAINSIDYKKMFRDSPIVYKIKADSYAT
jgi:hypothetical protein